LYDTTAGGFIAALNFASVIIELFQGEDCGFDYVLIDELEPCG